VAGQPLPDITDSKLLPVVNLDCRKQAKSLPVVLVVALLAFGVAPAALAGNPSSGIMGTDASSSGAHGHSTLCGGSSDVDHGRHGNSNNCPPPAPASPAVIQYTPVVVAPSPVPAPAVAAAPAQPQTMVTTAPLIASCSADYVVQSGNQLDKIASQFLGSARLGQNIVTATNSAAMANSSYHAISNPNLLGVGWRLCIPAASK